MKLTDYGWHLVSYIDFWFSFNKLSVRKFNDVTIKYSHHSRYTFTFNYIFSVYLRK